VKQSVANIDIELKDNKFKVSFNKPNYTYQFLTIEEAEELWQRLMQVCGEYRRGDIIEKVNN
jgi:hypothetical protein